MDLDDPKLTAYAIGEMEGPERAQMEAWLAADPAARAVVASIRQTAAGITAALALETSPGLGSERIDELLYAANAQPSPPRRDDVYHVITHPTPEPRRLRQSFLAVAAAIAILVSTAAILLSTVFRDWANRTDRNVARNDRSVDNNRSAIGVGASDGSDLMPQSPRGLIELIAESTTGGSTGGPGLTLSPVKPPTTPTRDAKAVTPPAYALDVESPFLDAARNPVSSFPFHPKSDSYEAVKQQVTAGQVPSRGSVRVEELVNAFNYGYAPPVGGKAFATYSEVASCPWEPKHRLVRVGLRARDDASPQALVANDLHVTVEFNPREVGAYRLIGFDRRLSTRAPNETPGNTVRAGQALTALYEIIPATARPVSDALKYQNPPQPTPAALSTELATLSVRYAPPVGPRQSEVAVVRDDPRPYADASGDFRFAAAVASYGLILTDSPHKGACSYDQVLALAESARGLDLDGERATFCDLVRRTRTLQ